MKNETLNFGFCLYGKIGYNFSLIKDLPNKKEGEFYVTSI